MFWASKIQVFNTSGDGFPEMKNQRRTPVKENEDILKIFFENKWDFFPLFFHFLELYDDMTRYSTGNAISINYYRTFS